MQTDLWPTTGVQFASDEHAAILAGLVAKNTSGVPRAGVLPRHTNALVTARPDMRVNVLPMELVHVKEGARFAALTETIDVAIPNPPSANTQYNIVAYVGTDQQITGIASTSNFVVIPGTPSADPYDPALPDAAIPIARVAVPSTATATNSAGVVITPLHPFTAAAGGTMLFRSTSEMNLWVPADAQLARVMGGSEYVRTAGVWRSRDRVAGVRFDGNTNVNGILVVNNPLLGMTPTWVQVTMGRIVASDLLSQLLSPIVWDTPVGDTTIQIRFRRHDTNAWAANQPVSGYLTAGG
ncbi:hypothetical protein SAMN06295974_0359 [Plantibacter flavus]|uniref:Uncharacterized protein n=1 Tax=Plantibacter flavus TaxID=150123 RepID=A0A3N2C1E9_9MICO|nr:hypothetical protein [Plantibacter flavus]ROR81134.1 hypothetical protein EDD42_1186 [Plantibacter flavus]SMG08200.1 hypothetical protein SAMN06295974_0359 [Plantibacter flavus]